MKHSFRPRGFTLVELLVVIAIIGILVAILLPAVNAAREAARRTQCMNNLKQLALALNSYHDQYKKFPAGDTWPEGAKVTESAKLGPNWVIKVLPFMEEQTLHDQFDFDFSITRSANAIARGTQITTMLCPTDEGAETLYTASRTGPTRLFRGNWARGNYAANAMNAPLSTGDRLEKAWGDPTRRGLMGPGVSVRIKDVVDGTSNTLLLSEIRIGVSERDRRGTWAMSGVGAATLYWHGWSRGSVGPANGPNDNSPSSDDIPGCIDIIRELRDQGVDNPVRLLASKGMTCRFNRAAAAPTLPNGGQAGTRSQHPGGVFAAMVDGSVHFIKDSIETSTECCSAWDRLILSRDDGVDLR